MMRGELCLWLSKGDSATRNAWQGENRHQENGRELVNISLKKFNTVS
jgi:hypothetical protein